MIARLLPLAVIAALFAVWEAAVRLAAIPPYILPAPSLILQTLVDDRALLGAALLTTLRIAALALLLAFAGGVALAILFSQARWLDRALYPLAVVAQVTPIIAIAPLLLVYLEPGAAVLVCAFLVAFFPVLANAAMGLGSADANLRDLFRLHRATRWQTLRLLLLPSALPAIMGGLRIAGGLALVGAIAAEIAAGAAGQGAGLAYRILEAGYRLNIPRMFAALALVALAGVAVHLAASALTRVALRRWRDE